MSKHKKKARRKGTDKQTLAAEESRLAAHDAGPPTAVGTMMQVEQSRECMPDRDGSPGATEAVTSAAAMAEPQTEPQVAPVASAETRATPVEPASLTLGQRLRQARLERGWSQEEVGNRLHLPVQIIQRLEAEQYEKIGYGIYLRGYLSSYARLVDVPRVLIDGIVRERTQAPPLVASGTISHSRYLYQRYSVSALYLILTGIIIVPAVLLAMRAGLHPHVAQLTALDAPAAPAQSPGPRDAAAAGARAGGGETAVQAARDAEPQPHAGASSDAPLVASLAPFSALSRKDDAARAQVSNAAAATDAAAPAPPPVPPAAGAHTFKITLSEASWIEVTSASGDKLEYGLLPAGSVRTYSSEGPLEVRLGNSNGAQVEIDGQSHDLAPFRHANVAHFRLFSAGQTISPTDS